MKEPKSGGTSNLTMVYVSWRALSPVYRSWVGLSACPFCTEDQELEVVGMYGGWKIHHGGQCCLPISSHFTKNKAIRIM